MQTALHANRQCGRIVLKHVRPAISVYSAPNRQAQQLLSFGNIPSRQLSNQDDVRRESGWVVQNGSVASLDNAAVDSRQRDSGVMPNDGRVN